MRFQQCALVALVTLVLLVGCSAPYKSGVAVTLEHGSLVPLGSTMTLRAVVDASIDGPDAEIIFKLPSGVTVVNGQARQKVQLRKDEQRTFEIEVRLDQPGEQHVGVEAAIYIDRSAKVKDIDYDAFYLEVSNAGTKVQQESIIPTPTSEGLNQRERLRQLVTPTPLTK